MIPKIIHYCWFGDAEIPPEYKSYIEEWGRMHSKWEIKKWDESNSPIDLPYMKKALENKKWANLSNLLRFHALKHFGGVYLDTDIKIMKPLDELLNNECFLGFEEGEENSESFWVNNAIIGARPQHPFIELCFQSIQERYDGTEEANLSAPRIVTELLREKEGLRVYGFQNLGNITLYPKDVFYPIHYNEIYKIKELDKNIKDETIAVHVWGRSWLSKENVLSMHDALLQEFNLKTNELHKTIEEKNHLMEKTVEQEHSFLVLNEKMESIEKNYVRLADEQLGLIESQKKEQNLRIKQLEDGAAILNQAVHNREELTTIKIELEKAKQALLEKDKIIDVTNKRIADLKTNELNTVSQYEIIRAELSQKVNQQQAKITEINDLLLKQVEAHKGEIIALKEAQLISQQKLFKEQQESFKSYQEQVSALLKANKEKETEVRTLTASLENKDKENKARVEEIAQQKKTIEEIRAEIEEAIQVKENLLKQIAANNKQKSYIEALETSVQDLKHMVQRGEHEIATTREHVIKREQETEQLKLTNKNLETTLENKNAEIRIFLQSELDKRRVSVEWYQNTYEKRRLIGIVKDRLIRMLR
ncbi:MAG TPA: glycosyltransferase [Bacteroidia bacterium]|jgi:predicted RNase H-like HicB family nuclease|nr:glycosyltransferase [Bacteroidia bacterium]